LPSKTSSAKLTLFQRKQAARLLLEQSRGMCYYCATFLANKIGSSNVVKSAVGSSSNSSRDEVSRQSLFVPRGAALGLKSPARLRKELRLAGDTARNSLMQDAQNEAIDIISGLLDGIQASQKKLSFALSVFHAELEARNRVRTEIAELDEQVAKTEVVTLLKRMSDVDYSLAEVEGGLNYFYCQISACRHELIREKMVVIRQRSKKQREIQVKNVAAMNAYKKQIGWVSSKNIPIYKGVLITIKQRPRKEISYLDGVCQLRKNKVYFIVMSVLSVVDTLQGLLNATDYLPEGLFKTLLKMIVPIIFGVAEALIEAAGIKALFDLNKELQALKRERKQEEPYLNWKHGAFLACALLLSLSNSIMEEYEAVFSQTPAIVRTAIEIVAAIATSVMFLLPLYLDTRLNKKITVEKEKKKTDDSSAARNNLNL
jgi:hypothetical protein